MRKTILITGGTGFIGSHTAVELIQQGYAVILLDNLSNSKADVVERITGITGQEVTFYHADIRDKTALMSIFKQHTVDAVIHFAALKDPQESFDKKQDYYSVNVTGTEVLLQVMEQCSVKKLVFSSSAVVYGDPARVPVNESAPTGEVNSPYGQTKYLAEQMLKQKTEQLPGWSIISLRYFNPAGAHASGVIGEQPLKQANNLIPAIGKVLLGKAVSLTIYGYDYPTKDGTAIRDYIHVCDLAQGHVAAVNLCLSRPGYAAYNLGTGRGESVADVVRSFEKASGQNIPVCYKSRRRGDVSSCYAQVDKASRELNWKATRGLEDIAKDYCHWLSCVN